MHTLAKTLGEGRRGRPVSYAPHVTRRVSSSMLRFARGHAASEQCGRVGRDVWLGIFRLCDAVADRGFPVSLVQLDAADAKSPAGICGRVLSADEIVSS